MIGRLLALLFGLAACGALLATLLYGVGLLGTTGLTRGTDEAPGGAFATSLRSTSPAVERGSFVLASSAALALADLAVETTGRPRLGGAGPWARACSCR